MDAEKLRKLKDEAAKFLGRGRIDKAIEIYAKVLESDPHDLQSRLKCGDLYRRLGKDAEAIACYHAVVEVYANEGLLLKAIAVCKLILEVDEDHTATQLTLAGLYAKKSGAGKAPVTAAAAKSAVGGSPPPLPIDALEIAAPPLADNGDVVLEDASMVAVVELAPAPPQEAREDLPQIPLFSDLSKNAFIALMERMKMRTAQPDEVIIQEGENGDSFFIIAQGEVRVEKQLETGKPLLLAVLGDGAFFGEMAVLSDSPRTASVIAQAPSHLFEISKSVLEQITREYASVAQVLLRFYKLRLLANLMATSRIFKLLTPLQRKELIEKFKSREVPAGEVILSEGQKGDGLYMILSGRVKVVKNKDENKQIVMARLKEGEVFGEMSLLSNTPVNATVTADKPCIILRLPRKSFAEVLSTHPQLLEHISDLSDERAKLTEAIVSGAVAISDDDVMMV